MITQCYCRLILHGHISSTHIVVKILLKYFNPATEEKLTQALGVFFENLIELRKQELLQEALVPTVNAIVDAPNDSPLAEIDPKTVIRFVIQSTRPEFCAPGLSIHDTIAMTFISTMKDLDAESSKDLVKTLVTELSNLEISGDHVLRDNFKSCVDELVEKFTDAKIAKGLMDFKKLLEDRQITSSSLPTNVENSMDSNGATSPAQTVGGDVETTAEDNVFKVPPARPKPSFLTEALPDVAKEKDFNAPESPEKSDTDDDSLPVVIIPATQPDPARCLDFTVPASPEPANETSASDLSTVVIPATQEETETVLSQEVVAQTPEVRSVQKTRSIRGAAEVLLVEKGSISAKATKTPRLKTPVVQQKKREHPPSSSDSSAVSSPVRKMPKSSEVTPSVRTRTGARQEVLANSLVTRNKTIVKTVGKTSSAAVNRSASEASTSRKSSRETLSKSLKETSAAPVTSRRSAPELAKASEKTEKRQVKPTEKMKEVLEAKRRSNEKAKDPSKETTQKSPVDKQATKNQTPTKKTPAKVSQESTSTPDKTPVNFAQEPKLTPKKTPSDRTNRSTTLTPSRPVSTPVAQRTATRSNTPRTTTALATPSTPDLIKTSNALRKTPAGRRIIPQTPTSTPSTPKASANSAIVITPSSVAALTPRSVSTSSTVKDLNLAPGSTPTSSKVKTRLVNPSTSDTGAIRKTRAKVQEEVKKPTTRSTSESNKRTRSKPLPKK